MKTIKRNRYYCDFCKKAGGRKDIIKKHEKGCTLNPDRDCGYCRCSGEDQQPIETLKQALNIDIAYYKSHQHEPKKQFDFNLKIKIPTLRKVSKNCPGCILAAIRQSFDIKKVSSIDDFHSFDFDFKEETKGFWHDYNEQQQYGSYVHY